MVRSVAVVTAPRYPDGCDPARRGGVRRGMRASGRDRPTGSTGSTTSSAPSPRPCTVRSSCWRAPAPARPGPSRTASRTASPPGSTTRAARSRSPSPRGRPARCASRLRALGVDGVQVRTFHAAALRQLRYFWPRLSGGDFPELLPSKARLVAEAASRCKLPTDTATVRDLASDLEWAKVNFLSGAGRRDARRCVSPHAGRRRGRLRAGADGLRGRQGGPRPARLRGRPARHGGALADRPDIADAVRAAYRWFTVDEYQDVNPLQQRLLGLWLGERDDVCVVGDANQTIYTFTGATPSYLTSFRSTLPRRHRGAARAVLPLHAADRLAGQRRHRAGRDQADPTTPGAALPAHPRPGAHASRCSTTTSRRRRRSRAGRPAAPRRRRAGARHRRAVPHQRPVGRSSRRRSPRRACRSCCAAPSGSSTAPRCARRSPGCAGPREASPAAAPRRRGARRAQHGRLDARRHRARRAPCASGGSRSRPWPPSPTSWPSRWATRCPAFVGELDARAELAARAGRRRRHARVHPCRQGPRVAGRVRGRLQRRPAAAAVRRHSRAGRGGASAGVRGDHPCGRSPAPVVGARPPAGRRGRRARSARSSPRRSPGSRTSATRSPVASCSAGPARPAASGRARARAGAASAARGLVTPQERTLGRCQTCPSDLNDDLLDALRAWRLQTARGRRRCPRTSCSPTSRSSPSPSRRPPTTTRWPTSRASAR